MNKNKFRTQEEVVSYYNKLMKDLVKDKNFIFNEDICNHYNEYVVNNNLNSIINIQLRKLN